MPRASALIDVCELIMGQAPPGEAYNDQAIGHPLIAGASDFDGTTPAPQKWTSVAPKLSQAGDIILGIRASIGETVWSDGVYCLGRGVAALRPNSAVHPGYLWHWLSQARPELNHRARGATFKQVTAKDIATLPIELPGVEEQRRIAAILDQAGALRAKRRAALAQLDEMAQAIFLEMFGREGGEAGGVKVSPLADIVRPDTIVTYGIVQAGDEFPDGVPYIRTGDLQGGAIRVDGLRHTDPAIAAKFNRSRVEEGDIVISIRATVGTTAIVPKELSGANLTQGTARIAPGDRMNRHYLLGFLRSEAAQSWIAKQLKGATFREITLERLRKLPVAVPPQDIQAEFANRVTCVEALKEMNQASEQSLDSLFASLQHRAFRGEL